MGVIFFYFDYNDSNNQTAEDVVAMLLKQILYQLDQLPLTLDETYDRCMEHGERDRRNSDAFTELLIECSKKFDSVFRIIDAFDECREGQRPSMVSCLQQLYESGMRLFLTSRSHLLEELKRSFEAIDCKIIAQDDDIKKYLEQNLRHKSGLHSELKAEIIKKIADGVSGKYRPLTA